jgi:hypothetical protein
MNCLKTKVSQWSDKNELKRNQIIKGTQKEYLFNCLKCNHEFRMKIQNMLFKSAFTSPY